LQKQKKKTIASLSITTENNKKREIAIKHLKENAQKKMGFS